MDREDVDGALTEATNDLMRKGEEAEGFINDGISKIRSKMSSSDKSYPPPTIPETPSKAINDMLKSKCGQTFTSPVKYYIASFICLVFTAILKIYKLIYKDNAVKPSHTMWMAACAIVTLEHILACCVVYYVIIACSFLLHHILYYGVVLFCLFGVGLAVAGMVFFDKDKKKTQSPGFEPKSD